MTASSLRWPQRRKCRRLLMLAGVATLLLPQIATSQPTGTQETPSQPDPFSDAPPQRARPLSDQTQLILWSLRVPGATLSPRENDVSYTVGGTGGCFYVTAGDATTVWNVPVILPDGALVDTLRIYYYDTSANNMTAWFTVYDLYGTIVDEWSVSSNTSGGNSFNDSAQINHTINYGAYSYAVNVRPLVTGSTMQFCGARIFYAPPAEIFADGFETGNTIRWSNAVP